MASSISLLRSARDVLNLSSAAKAELSRDLMYGLGEDPGPEAAVAASVDWLCEAQDRSTSMDGGVARHYSLTSGWSASYPETTGYIVPTMIVCARWTQRNELRDRARRMADWLVSIQLPCGSFQGGVIGQEPVVPVTFNTGQILMGLAAAVSEFGDEYRTPLERAADWLVDTQDADGCWRKHASPFASPGEKTYETHVSWGLFEAERVAPGRGYGEAAVRNVRWALTRQRANGWFDACSLTDADRPLTHTIGYALRGVLEAYRFTSDASFLEPARRTADGSLSALGPDGWLPGRLDHEWNGSVKYACLTGSVQIASCWFMLHDATGDRRYRDAGLRANSYVRRTVRTSGAPEIRGAVKGSFPVQGRYGPYQYLNWASKFFIDSNLTELELRATETQ